MLCGWRCRMYQPVPDGWWQSRRVLWAVEQVLAKQRERQQAKLRRAWQYRIQQVIAAKVLAYPWERYWRALTKQDELAIPQELATAFEAVVALIPKLWDDAAKAALAQAMVRGFNQVFARAVFRQGVEATMGLIRKVPDTLRTELRRALREAMEAGETQWDFARRVRQLWSGVSRERAELIAWTEWARGVETMNHATLIAGNVPYKVWITVGDDHVCDICRNNAAQGPIPTQQPFASGDAHAPAHPRCRCTISGLLSPEV